MKLSETRTRLSDTLDELVDLRAGFEHAPTAPQAKDAWPVLRRIEPATFGTCTVTWDVLVVLPGDETSAFTVFGELAIPVLDALGHAGFTPVSATPQIVPVNGADVFCAAITVLSEVEP